VSRTGCGHQVGLVGSAPSLSPLETLLPLHYDLQGQTGVTFPLSCDSLIYNFYNCKDPD
jgi:hypothetical protein